MRLDKFLSESTSLSRKEIKRLIKAGEVFVNGAAASRPEQQVNEQDIAEVRGERIEYKRYVYLVLNKPAGYVSASEDKRYPCVTELAGEKYAHYGVFPVGRLDVDTEGLLLLTNDGGFAHAVASPKKNVYKRYFARLDTPAEEKDKALFEAGMKFKDFTAMPARLEICADPREVFIEIAEGKYHQVKRMAERAGKKVIYLKRVAIGSLALPEDSAPGDIFEAEKGWLFEKIGIRSDI